ncbi:MAG: ABC transporter permease [Thermomicrobiales bacterium]|nr:ABC transporter permease [Thermomicrobiales bacterium]
MGEKSVAEAATRTRSNEGEPVSASRASGLTGAEREKHRSHARRVLRELVRNKFALAGACYLLILALLAIFAPVVAPYSPTDQSLLNRLSPPGGEHWLGTDELGRDELSRLIWGARTSLFIALIGTTGGVIVGTTLGMLSGFFGGWFDILIMRLIDIMFAFPGILLAILIVAVMGPGLFNLIVALTIWGTPALARIVRSSVLSLKQVEFVEASRAIGSSGPRIMLRHLLPNCIAPIIVYATLGVAGALLTTAGLGFLGIGVQPPTSEWGAMLSVGRSYLRETPWLMIVPGLAILFTVISLNLIGDALRDALDPRIGH